MWHVSSGAFPADWLARFPMLTCIRIAAWLLAAAIVVLSLVPPSMRPETAAPHDLEHFAIFAATGMAFGLGYTRQFFGVAAALVIFTGAVELAQIVVPGRHARVSDFVVDAVAVLIGLVASSFMPLRKIEERP
jgi:VanZ family protein